jgi:hypothetical protein
MRKAGRMGVYVDRVDVAHSGPCRVIGDLRAFLVGLPYTLYGVLSAWCTDGTAYSIVRSTLAYFF